MVLNGTNIFKDNQVILYVDQKPYFVTDKYYEIPTSSHNLGKGAVMYDDCDGTIGCSIILEAGSTFTGSKTLIDENNSIVESTQDTYELFFTDVKPEIPDDLNSML